MSTLATMHEDPEVFSGAADDRDKINVFYISQRIKLLLSSSREKLQYFYHH